jgi:hypothetical protein
MVVDIVCSLQLFCKLYVYARSTYVNNSVLFSNRNISSEGEECIDRGCVGSEDGLMLGNV